MVNIEKGITTMIDTRDIEKKSLEAHVELCAERYRFLEEKLETVEEKVTELNNVVKEVHNMVQRITEKRSDQIISWGIGIIGTLVAIVGYLLANFVLK